MQIHELNLLLQSHFTDGLVVIIGSGLSAAAGLPTMGQLEHYLDAYIPTLVAEEILDEWNAIASIIKAGRGLEAAINEISPSAILEDAIVRSTAKLVSERESIAIEHVISNGIVLPFSKLAERVIIPNSGLPVITTNYDRLIEFSAECIGLGVDQMFLGQCYGTLDAQLSKESFVAKLELIRKLPVRKYRKRINLCKPHGSLDWYWHNNRPLRCAIPISSPRLMITPGSGKYAKGYESPFDAHRERANHAIDSASRFLIVGYGFNDWHLETHLRKKIKQGTPCVLLTRELTPKGVEVVEECRNVISLTHGEFGVEHGTTLMYNGETHFFPAISYWDLDRFITGVL